eukprot:767677-Hanusia_phi.AAC.1
MLTVITDITFDPSVRVVVASCKASTRLCSKRFVLFNADHVGRSGGLRKGEDRPPSKVLSTASAWDVQGSQSPAGPHGPRPRPGSATREDKTEKITWSEIGQR